MKNLAGDPDCDRTIVQELERAGLELVRLDQVGSELPSRLRGRLGPIEFTRGWVYWIAEGPVPLLTALDLYAHPIARRDVRVQGQGIGPAPESPWLQWYTPDGARVLPMELK